MDLIGKISEIEGRGVDTNRDGHHDGWWVGWVNPILSENALSGQVVLKNLH